MTDPYKVLGITPDATDDQVKEAYRKLAKKYHPDAYAGNPLSDLASEKMAEINEAYDTIMSSRRERGNSSGSSSSQNNYGYRGSYSKYTDVRRLIDQRRLEEADEILNGVPENNRDAEWNFLKGCVLYSKGWFDGALNYLRTAVNMDPSNPEYRTLYNRMMAQRSGGFMGGNPYHTSGAVTGCSPCGLCQSMLCADCCCECLGGDLISCC